MITTISKPAVILGVCLCLSTVWADERNSTDIRLASNFNVVGAACEEPVCHMDQLSCDQCRPNWTFGVEYLNWRLRRSDLDYAIPTDATALVVGAGPVESLRFPRDSGVRASLGYLTCSGWEIGVAYTYFHTSAAATVAEPAGGNLWATRSHPNRGEEALTATALGSLDFNTLDLTTSRAFCVTDHTSLKMVGGLRWASISQDARFLYDGRDFNDGMVNQPINMDAFGFRLGLDGYWHVWRGWSVFGRGSGSIMHGEFQNRLLETNNSGVDTLVNIADSYSHVVPVLEAAVGVSWRWRERLDIVTGYEMAAWLNAGTRSAFVDNVHEGLYNTEATDLLLEGYFLRCNFAF